MKTKLLLLISLILMGITIMFSCKKDSIDPGSSLRILKSPLGQNQSISANIDNAGYTNFNAQTILADGGNPTSRYTWSLDLSSNPPAGVTIANGVINRIGNTINGLKVGTTTFKVTVSDGSVSRTESIDLMVSDYTPGYSAVFQQLSIGFQLKDAEANEPYAASLFAMGGTPPYSWKLDETFAGSKDLTNAGLVVDGTGGIVRCTSFNSASGKVINFKVIVTDKGGAGDIAIYSPVYTIVIK
ncbi:MAG: hypothetical protein H8E34_10125 [Bacteroidetes bacterium]|nr:hypothetical protein [Bacteroidota bacterium]MBL6944509.1 hypothetical protein [Bacteroidales bacterium]